MVARLITPRLQFSVMCRQVLNDNTGPTSFIDVFNGLRVTAAPEVPGGPPSCSLSFFVVNQWTGGIGVFHQHTEIRDPEGSLFAQSDEVEFALTSRGGAHRVYEFFQVGIHLPGRYIVQIMLENDCLLEYFFPVDFRNSLGV